MGKVLIASDLYDVFNGRSAPSASQFSLVKDIVRFPLPTGRMRMPDYWATSFLLVLGCLFDLPTESSHWTFFSIFSLRLVLFDGFSRVLAF